jgi:hypothetical protein
MCKIKSIFLLIILLTSSLNYAQFTDVINSNRPGLSMGSFSVGKKVIQAELGFYGYDENHSLDDYTAQGIGSNLDIRYGDFFEQLEFIAQFQYQYESYQATLADEVNSGLSQTTIGAKYLLYDPLKNYEAKPNIYSWNANHKFDWRQFIPAVGLYAGMNFNFVGDEFSRPGIPENPSWSGKVMAITQNQFGKSVLVTNIILDKFATNRQSLDFLITLTHGFGMRWSGFVEIDSYNSDYYTDVIARAGGAYLLKQNVQIDLSAGTNFKDTPSLLIGGLGISWRFDDNYKQEYTRVKKEKEKKTKEEKKKDKKKAENKKRLDEVESTPVQP